MNAAGPSSYNLPAKRRRHERPPSAVRILGRRYPLTSTYSKYLEIGISVGSVSDVEVIIGDRGYQITLPIVTWQTLMEKIDAIKKLLDESSSSPLWIRDLQVQIDWVHYDEKMFKLIHSGSYLCLEKAEMMRLFNLKDCVERMYVRLMKKLPHVSSTFKSFVDLLQKCNQKRNITCDAEKIIRGSNIFKNGSLIHCEILACNLNEIMYDVSHNK